MTTMETAEMVLAAARAAQAARRAGYEVTEMSVTDAHGRAYALDLEGDEVVRIGERLDLDADRAEPIAA